MSKSIKVINVVVNVVLKTCKYQKSNQLIIRLKLFN